MATPLDPVVSYLQDLLGRIFAQPAAYPIVLVGGSIAVIKYLVLPFFIEAKYHTRILVGILVVDGALLGVSYSTGLLSLPFGITIPTIDLSIFSVSQAELALFLGIGGLAAYSAVVLFHERIGLDLTGVSDFKERITNPSTLSRSQISIIGVLAFGFVLFIANRLGLLQLPSNLALPGFSVISPSLVFAPVINLTGNYPQAAVLAVAISLAFLAGLLFVESVD